VRIRYLSQYYPPEPGAPAARVSGLSRLWARAGHHVEVVTGLPNHPNGVVLEPWRGRVATTDDDQGVRVLRNWLFAVPNRRIAQRVMSQASYAVSVSTLGLARAGRSDVVIATSPSIFTGWAGLVHARAARVPFVLEVRDLWPQLFVEMRMIRNPVAIRAASAMELALYRSADLIVTVTHRFREIIAGRGIPQERIAVIPNGVDLEGFSVRPGQADEIRRRYRLSGRFVVSYVGTHGVLHRLDFLLDVAERLREDPRFHVLFVGDGAERPKLEALARSRGLGNVTFAGLQPHADVPAFYAASDVCYVPLRPDPFLADNFVPSKIFEILAVGTPILGCVGGEAAGILESSGISRVVAPGDVPGIERALREFAEEPVGASARAGARDYARGWARETLAERYLRRLETLVEAETAR